MEARRLRELLERLSAERYSIPGPDYSGIPHGAPGAGAAFEPKVMRYVDTLALYEKRLAEIDAMTLAIEYAIGTLEDPSERLVMRLRYVEGLRWVNVCVALQELGHSERAVYRMHGAALQKLKGF